MRLITKINWTLHTHCKSECSYCPSSYRSGERPKDISEYLKIANMLIKHYDSLNRDIHWNFNGGEPLDDFNFPELLKLCKTQNNNIQLTTNGGKLWLDWWAIEPYIDTLNLSYHYWQNFNLIRYIIQTFIKHNKSINVLVPIRPKEHFDEDWNRSILIEKEFNLNVQKIPLTKINDYRYVDYTEDQFEKLLGKEWVEQNLRKPPKELKEIFQEKLDTNPSFTGQLCNVGIEMLNISGEGWASGSGCNNLHLGNIWNTNFKLPDGPTACKMISCINGDDQKITKFKKITL